MPCDRLPNSSRRKIHQGVEPRHRASQPTLEKVCGSPMRGRLTPLALPLERTVACLPPLVYRLLICRSRDVSTFLTSRYPEEVRSKRADIDETRRGQVLEKRNPNWGAVVHQLPHDLADKRDLASPDDLHPLIRCFARGEPQAVVFRLGIFILIAVSPN